MCHYRRPTKSYIESQMTITEIQQRCARRRHAARFDERAPAYDRDNEFFTRLRGVARAVPVGIRAPGLGRGRPEPGRDQPAAAAHRLRRPGDGRGGQHAPLLRRAVRRPAPGRRPHRRLGAAPGGRGAVFAAGHGETGNDIPVLLSSTKAERVEGGWEFTGHKIFGSLSPVWTHLGIHGMDTSDPANPQIVHAFLHRDATNYRIEADVGHDGDAGDDVERHHPGRAPSCPTRRSSGFARPGSPAPACSTSPCSPGRCSASPASTARRPAGVRRHRRQGPPAHVDGADPLDGLPPGGAARGRRDAHPPRGADRPPRPGVRRLGRRRRPRHGLADEDRRLQVRRRHPGVGRRRPAFDLTGGAGIFKPQPLSSNCSATPASAASTRATPCSPTSSSASSASASTPTNSPAGADAASPTMAERQNDETPSIADLARAALAASVAPRTALPPRRLRHRT